MRCAGCSLAIVAGLALAAPAVAHALPAIDVECNQSPTCDGVWFTQPVFVDWTVTGGTITSGCQDITIQEDTSARLEGCAASGGGTASANITLKVDQTPPVVTEAVPDRAAGPRRLVHAPGHVHAARGSDARPASRLRHARRYGGPDSAGAALVGPRAATRQATSARARSRSAIDATPPDPSAATVKTGDRMVRLCWPAGCDRERHADARDRWRRAASMIYEGAGTGFTDREVRNGRRYQYVLTLTDEAGNAASRELTRTPSRQLLTPAKRAVLAAPPLLSWTPVRGARYYNVQLFRDGRKILSAWPREGVSCSSRRSGGTTAADIASSRAWSTRGTCGPGEGPRDARRYGKRIGARSFVLARP